MSYVKMAQAAENAEFRRRVKAALFELAQIVALEPNSTPGHQRRFIMAQAVTRSPDDYVSQLAWLCAASEAVWSTVAEDGSVNAADETIKVLCGQAWNAVAGVE